MPQIILKSFALLAFDFLYMKKDVYLPIILLMKVDYF